VTNGCGRQTAEASLAKEEDTASQARLEDLPKEFADLRAEADAVRARWEAERRAGTPL
jgi:ATP-dependent Clp protease ATP-binding subunit ClpB